MKRVLKIAKDLGIEIFGSLIVAIGIYNFAVNANFPMTGFSGIALIIYKLFGLPIGMVTLIMNIPMAFICWRLLGHKFLLKSFSSMVILAIFTDFVAPMFPTYNGDRLLAAICTGGLIGLGYALIYTVHSSTGGADFIIMAIKAVRPHLAVGKISFALDLMTIIAGAFVFREVDGIIYGFIVTFITAKVVNRVMFGLNTGKMTLIVTDKGEEVCAAIDESVQRGATIIKALGSYRMEEHDVVMCVCSDKEMPMIRSAVKEVDPVSFLIILESNEVHGEGFQPLLVGERINRQKKQSTDVSN